MMKGILYLIFAIIAVGIATIVVLSAKVIGFLLGIVFAIVVVAFIIFMLFASLFNRDEPIIKSETKYSEPEDKDPNTRVFR